MCNTIGNNIKKLRRQKDVKQDVLATSLHLRRQTVSSYERGITLPNIFTLIRIADYFDVSLDYIFARTDKPQGKIYEFRPKASPAREEMRRFIEMCFDPQSPMNEKLKETLLRMMEDGE